MLSFRIQPGAYLSIATTEYCNGILKLTEFSKSVLLLREKMRNRELFTPNSAKNKWKFDPVFMRHKLDNLRKKLNQLKAKEPENDNIFYMLLIS